MIGPIFRLVPYYCSREYIKFYSIAIFFFFTLFFGFCLYITNIVVNEPITRRINAHNRSRRRFLRPINNTNDILITIHIRVTVEPSNSTQLIFVRIVVNP